MGAPHHLGRLLGADRVRRRPGRTQISSLAASLYASAMPLCTLISTVCRSQRPTREFRLPRRRAALRTTPAVPTSCPLHRTSEPGNEANPSPSITRSRLLVHGPKSKACHANCRSSEKVRCALTDACAGNFDRIPVLQVRPIPLHCAQPCC